MKIIILHSLIVLLTTTVCRRLIMKCLLLGQDSFVKKSKTSSQFVLTYNLTIHNIHTIQGIIKYCSQETIRVIYSTFLNTLTLYRKINQIFSYYSKPCIVVKTIEWTTMYACVLSCVLTQIHYSYSNRSFAHIFPSYFFSTTAGKHHIKTRIMTTIIIIIVIIIKLLLLLLLLLLKCWIT